VTLHELHFHPQALISLITSTLDIRADEIDFDNVIELLTSLEILRYDHAIKRFQWCRLPLTPPDIINIFSTATENPTNA